MRRAVVFVVVALCLSTTSIAAARPAWKTRIDRALTGRSAGVSVHLDGKSIYEHDSKARRVPASNEKLLLSMALYDTLSPGFRIPTSIRGALPVDGIVHGRVWLSGRGDPSVTGGGGYGRDLPFQPTRLGHLARLLKKSGVRKITGRVVGTTGFFAHDWFAPGWKSYFPSEEVALPSALTIDGNTHDGVHITNPEWRAARALTKRLRSIGVAVAKPARAGRAPRTAPTLVMTTSSPLHLLVRYMNRESSNFFAEVLGKLLGAVRYDAPGTIAKGAKAIARWWARRRHVSLDAHDSSGLSYANRVSPRGMVRLLEAADRRRWGPQLRKDLPTGGQGTLEDRLQGIPMRAKTGTLDGVSALSGWVWLHHARAWAEFSILSAGMPKYSAARMEDRVVRVLAHAARPRSTPRSSRRSRGLGDAAIVERIAGVG